MSLQIMIDKILEEERELWELYKEALEKNGGHDGSVQTLVLKQQHNAMQNLIDKLEIKR